MTEDASERGFTNDEAVGISWPNFFDADEVMRSKIYDNADQFVPARVYVDRVFHAPIVATHTSNITSVKSATVQVALVAEASDACVGVKR